MDILDILVYAKERNVYCILCDECLEKNTYMNAGVFMVSTKVQHMLEKHTNNDDIICNSLEFAGIKMHSFKCQYFMDFPTCVFNFPQMIFVEHTETIAKIQEIYNNIAGEQSVTYNMGVYNLRLLFYNTMVSLHYICANCKIPYDNGFPDLQTVVAHIIRTGCGIHPNVSQSS